MAANPDETKQDETTKQKVVICGGGNAAHVFFGLSSRDANNDTYLFSLFRTEAEDFKKSVIENSKKLIIEVAQNNTKMECIVNSDNITKDPSCLISADIIIISLPAFAHAQYLGEIAKNVGEHKCLIGIFPGASGLECDWQYIICNKDSCKYGLENYTLLSNITLPWACRIKEFGKIVEILGTKQSTRVSLYPNYDKKYIEKFNKIIGDLPELINYGHLLNMSLGATNAIIHPSILYSKWYNWDNKPVNKKPLFYQGINEFGANLLSNLSDETILITKCIEKETNINTLKTRHIFESYKISYGDKCKDTSTLYSTIKTNPAYEGLVHPMIEYTDKDKDKDNNDQKDDETLYVPNFKHRYFTEDIPYGLIVIKGIALLLKEIPETPNIDKVIIWAQKVMGKEYFVYSDDKVPVVSVGKNINETRAPQKYDFKDISQLL